MVLLTSSAISGIISAAVVSLFTFLLFLSGYVLQQQTVRSLQEALRQPPPPKPRFSLPPQFQTENGSEAAQVVQTAQKNAGLPDIFQELKEGYGVADRTDQSVEVHLVQDVQQPIVTADNMQVHQPSTINAVLPLDNDSGQGGIHVPVLAEVDNMAEDMPPPSAAAFILPLLTPAEVCGALLFAQQRTALSLHKATPMVLLYPSTWETEPCAESLASLDLLRSAIDSPTNNFGHISLHPVQISSVWSGPGMIEGQLLAEMQRSRWEYQRLLYLRLPGLALDVLTLDWALQASDLRRYWAPLSSIASSSSSTALQHPPVLLWSSTKGLVAPRGEMRRLTTSLSRTHFTSHKRKTETETKAANKGAAWVTFDEAELEHWPQEQELEASVIDTYERSRRGICRGTGLLEE